MRSMFPSDSFGILYLPLPSSWPLLDSILKYTTQSTLYPITILFLPLSYSAYLWHLIYLCVPLIRLYIVTLFNCLHSISFNVHVPPNLVHYYFRTVDSPIPPSRYVLNLPLSILDTLSIYRYFLLYSLSDTSCSLQYSVNRHRWIWAWIGLSYSIIQSILLPGHMHLSYAH